jgi:hypothetical protein
MAQQRVWTVRVLFVLAVLLVPAELLVQRALDSQPYPAVYQPDFRGTPLAQDGGIRLSKSSASVTFADGEEADLDFASLVPETQLSTNAVIRTAFGNQAAADEPDSRAFLKERLAGLFPDREAVSATFLWKSVLVDLAGEELEPERIDREVEVDLR